MCPITAVAAEQTQKDDSLFLSGLNSRARRLCAFLLHHQLIVDNLKNPSCVARWTLVGACCHVYGRSSSFSSRITHNRHSFPHTLSLLPSQLSPLLPSHRSLLPSPPFLLPSFLCVPPGGSDASDLLTPRTLAVGRSYCRNKALKTPNATHAALAHARNLDQLTSALALCLHRLALGKEGFRQFDRQRTVPLDSVNSDLNLTLVPHSTR